MSSPVYTSPAFQFYVSDRFIDLMPITGDNEAIGAWTKAFMYLWAHGPTKAETLQKASGSGWERCWFLFVENDGLMQIEWMEKYRAEKVAFVRIKSENGKKGGRPKATFSKGKKAVGSFSLTKTKANESSSARKIEIEIEGSSEKKERAGENDTIAAEVWPRFTDWWEIYRKGSKKLSFAEWEKIPQNDREAIMDHTPQYIASKPEVKYRKDGERYLKYRAWEDQIINETADHGQKQANRAKELQDALDAHLTQFPNGFR